MIYIENEGALFKGPARAWPREVWTKEGWKPYKGHVPKDIEWGDEIDEAKAKRMMGADQAQPDRDAPKQAAE